MSAAEMYTPQALILTDKAIAKVKALVEEEANDELKLRVFARPSGQLRATSWGASGFSTCNSWSRAPRVPAVLPSRVTVQSPAQLSSKMTRLGRDCRVAGMSKDSPPLISTKDDIDQIIAGVDGALGRVFAS